MKYYAAVDKDGLKGIWLDKPEREGDEWVGELILLPGPYLENFPNITWDDEPIRVKLSIEIDEE